jgi:hypothetical protein
MCDKAAHTASIETGVPLDVLLAVTRSETGRAVEGTLSPWPWTVNMEGAGKWFSTRSDAIEFVRRHHEKGARSFDVGCFQVNYKWHGRNFESLEQMFDPVSNALYAAEFLRSLRQHTDGWSAAAGAYHSRTPKYSKRYRARFDQIIATLDSGRKAPIPFSRPARNPRKAVHSNSYPFLQIASTVPRHGSLVPLRATTQSTIPFLARKEALE